MHTRVFKLKEGKKTVEHTVHYDGHFEGDVLLENPDYVKDDPESEPYFKVPFELLEQLVLEKYKDRMISKLEDANYEELKGLLGLV